jgi:hypothetical protein
LVDAETGNAEEQPVRSRPIVYKVGEGKDVEAVFETVILRHFPFLFS